jgi:hypothetical protein
MQISERDVQRFWKRVAKTDGCWLWAGKPNKINGYGRIRVNGVITGAHRFSYALAHGDIPSGMLIRHKCDTPLCVRPDHLLAGTDKDNAQDCIDRGRKPKGERVGSAKLSNDDVSAIQYFYNKRGWGVVRLARKYKVDRSTIYRIVNQLSRT